MLKITQAILLGILLSLFAMPGAIAQSTSGTIVGVAKTGDKIEVRQDEIGFVRELTAKRDGKYKMSHVPPGTYVVTKTDAAGEVESHAVTVQGGRSARVP